MTSIRSPSISHAVKDEYFPIPLSQGYLLDDGRYDCGLRPLDHCNDGALPSMAILVGKYGIDLIAQGCFVYAAALAHIPSQQDPVCGMTPLLPARELAQVMLVVALHLAALNMKESCQ